MLGLIPTSVRTALIALAWTAAASVVQAAPNTDRVNKQTADKGVVESRVARTSSAVVDGAASLGRQVRDTTSDLVISAMAFIGVPYKRGGNTADSGFDCSGFTREVYENSIGLLLPRKVDQQAKASGLAPVKRSDLKPGDLVFFNTLKRTFSHVGIYVGDDKFIHAPKPGGEVRVESLGVRYWSKRFTGARRPEQVSAVPAAETAAPEPSTAVAPAAATVDEPLTP